MPAETLKAETLPAVDRFAKTMPMFTFEPPEKPEMSIIIPAHNEEAVIGRCLQSLLRGARDNELEIIVACNGCTDRTAEIAASFGDQVLVVETATSSKIAALNLGDRAATGFPRFYLDADVVITIEALRRTASLLRSGTCLAASPSIEWDLRRSNWFVWAFYSVWEQQPYFDNGRLGAGLYAVSEEGHARLGEFPPITADDEYVRRKFSNQERATVPGTTIQVTPPRTLGDLIRIKTRSRRGTRELIQKFPELKQPTAGTRGQLVMRIAARPWLWLAAPVYAAVVVLTWWRSRPGADRSVAWERDLTSRTMEPHC